MKESKGIVSMKHELKVGDFVEWKSEGARAKGSILKKISTPMKFKTYTVHASKGKPQFFIKREKTGLVVLHKGTALKWIGEKEGETQNRPAPTRSTKPDKNKIEKQKVKINRLRELEVFGQSVWMDFIRRKMIVSGELKRLIAEDGLGGVTSNPSIFEKAIAENSDYDTAIHKLALRGKTPDQIYTALTVGDIQDAADLFRPLYDRLNGADGFVSLEVSPHLARDTHGTILEARRLWAAVDRPNVLIKVPGTKEGLPAIRQLIGEGINVNVTLLFGLPRYGEVAEAYIAGLETLVAQGKPLKSATSVASFFLSRIDVLVDPMLEKEMKKDKSKADLAKSLHGQVAILSAKAAYQIYEEIFNDDRFVKLQAQGAKSQRLLWASTSTKNPAYSDLKYVDSLIGPETINTIPMETLAAYRDHGKPGYRLSRDGMRAPQMLRRLPEVGIDLDAVTQQLEDEGVQKFTKAFDVLMDALRKKRSQL